MENFLNDTYKLIKKYKDEEVKSGKSFNIFKILNINHDEVKISSFLYELLNINGSHGQGSFFLKSFIHNVLHIFDISDIEIEKIKTYKEKITFNNRRIDLCLYGENEIIGIEVKIYAYDQDKQLFDYYNDLKRYNKKTYLYYLTLDGKNASNESINELSNDDYKCISFVKDIIPWIDNCCKSLEKYPNIATSLFQFNYILKNLCNQNDEDVDMNIQKLISSSKENLEAAIKIQKNVDKAKIEIIKNFMTTIKDKAKLANIAYEETYFNKNDGSIDNYYTKQKPSWPSLNIKYKTKQETGSNKEVFLRLEIEDNLFIGYCVTSDGENHHDNSNRLDNELEKEIIANHPSFTLGKTYNWWICWKHILVNNEKIDFRNFNDNAISLIDPEVMDEVTNIVIDEIKILMK